MESRVKWRNRVVLQAPVKNKNETFGERNQRNNEQIDGRRSRILTSSASWCFGRLHGERRNASWPAGDRLCHMDRRPRRDTPSYSPPNSASTKYGVCIVLDFGSGSTWDESWHIISTQILNTGLACSCQYWRCIRAGQPVGHTCHTYIHADYHQRNSGNTIK